MRSRTAIIVSAFLFLCPMMLHAQEPIQDSTQEPVSWLSEASGYITVYYMPGADLKQIEGKLKDKVFFFGEMSSKEGLNDKQRILYRLNLLFDYTQTILNMHLTDLCLNIRIFKTQEELDSEYRSIFKKERKYKAFYVDTTKTIYVSEEGISESVIMHEMSHAIVDNYFKIVPPENISELIVSYVDKHLE